MDLLKRLCLSCPQVISKGSRCNRCQSAYRANKDKIYGSSYQRGYDTEYLRNRDIVLAESNICWICEFPGATTVDHIIPLSFGGTNDLSNLKPCHSRCNSSRGNKA